MARNQSSFDYDKLEPKIQDFLRKKEKEINELLDRNQLRYRYSLGEKLVEVQVFLEGERKNYYYPWLGKVFINRISTLDEHTYCYTYINNYLGGIAVLEANPKISYSVFVKLGRSKATEDIKRRFAERIKSGETITRKDVDEAIDRECPEKVKTRNSSNGLKSSINSNQTHDLEIAVIKLKELLDNKEKKESKYQILLQEHPRLLGYNYQQIERHKNLDERYIPDFTGVRFRDNQRDIIEIKQPFITLFRKDGEFSHEFNKAWNKVEEYLKCARDNKHYLQDKGLSFDNPECYLIIGYQLPRTQLDKIKIKESCNLAIKVLTYDNLISVAEGIINSSKKAKPEANLRH
jgi:hypothetical protein